MDLNKGNERQATEENAQKEREAQEQRLLDKPPVAAGTAASQRTFLNDMNASVKGIDKNVIVRLLKNPLESLNLNGSKDLVYGALGIAAAIIGFLIWTLFVGNRLENIIMRAFGFGGISNIMDLLDRRSSISAAIFGKMILISILSSASLLGAIWSIGYWKGGQRLSIKALITHIGAMQYITGAGFILSGILALMSFKLSIFVLLLSLLSSLVLSITGATELFQVAKERRALYMILTISAYLLLFMVLGNIVL